MEKEPKLNLNKIIYKKGEKVTKILDTTFFFLTLSLRLQLENLDRCI